MKARTKIQKRVELLSRSVPHINQQQQDWAAKTCLPHLGYVLKSSVFCLDCGLTFSPELISRKRVVCPHCSTKLVIELTRKTTNNFTTYFAITHLVEEAQVVQHFEINASYKKGRKAEIVIHPILEDWIFPDGKVVKIGKNHNCNWNCDSWSGHWEIREGRKRNGYYRSRYIVYPRYYHPDSVFKAEYLKIGINFKLKGISVLEAIDLIPEIPIAETLLKAKQYDLLSKLVDYPSHVISRWPSIKICLRNKYRFPDVGVWLDYLDLLQYFKKDLHNAKFVCPANLKKEHNRLVKKKRAIQRLEEQEQERKRVIERQKKLDAAIEEYMARIQKFLDLEIIKGNISIKPLQSIDEFKAEGDELDHCVYTNEYYLKTNSLIFSARVDGQRTETIELNLEKMKIEQARGKGNEASEYNKSIVALMKKNIPLIKKIMKQQTA